MGEAKDKLERRRISFEARITVVCAVIAALVGLAANVISDYIIKNSDNARRCNDLEQEVKHKDELLLEKQERLEDHRIRIAELNTALGQKDSMIALKDFEIRSFSAKVYPEQGRMITTNDYPCAKDMLNAKTDAEVMKHIIGTMGERLGIDENLPPIEKIKKTWTTPLLVPALPCIAIPAPKGLLDDYFKLIVAYGRKDFTNAVRIAAGAYEEIKPMVEPFVARGANIDARFAVVASKFYEIMAEDSFCRKDFSRAALLIGYAAGMFGVEAPPSLLALESAMFYRAGLGGGFFTQHMSDVFKTKPKDDKFRDEVFIELASLGYLQLYLPNEKGTDIGKPIDWKTTKGAPIPLRKTFVRDGDVWSTRWAGFGKDEEFNVSAEFRRDCKQLKVLRMATKIK